MRIAGEERISVAFRQFRQGALKCRNQAADVVNLGTQIEAHVGHDLIVAASGGMQLASRLADFLNQAVFDMRVNVF